MTGTLSLFLFCPFLLHFLFLPTDVFKNVRETGIVGRNLSNLSATALSTPVPQSPPTVFPPPNSCLAQISSPPVPFSSPFPPHRALFVCVSLTLCLCSWLSLPLSHSPEFGQVAHLQGAQPRQNGWRQFLVFHNTDSPLPLCERAAGYLCGSQKNYTGVIKSMCLGEKQKKLLCALETDETQMCWL